MLIGTPLGASFLSEASDFPAAVPGFSLSFSKGSIARGISLFLADVLISCPYFLLIL